jgi:hypothetical protein
MDLPESLKAALGTAGGGADAATAAVDTAVSSAVASASKLTAVAMESLNQRYEIGVAHATAAWWEVQALEDKVFEAPTTALASAIKDAPYATAVAGTTCALLAVPGTRRILWHMSFGRMQSEEALVRAATRRRKGARWSSCGCEKPRSPRRRRCRAGGVSCDRRRRTSSGWCVIIPKSFQIFFPQTPNLARI